MKRDKHDLSEEVNSDYKIKPSNMNWLKPIKMSQHQKEVFHELTNYEPVELSQTTK
ncbi:hypothetical protein P9B58_04565 [Bacillus mojavensis]|uniref:hypothetical protein n=1 Tax=Bacillus mojavensis TaxID=72360 RepID=UPI002DB69B0F|nr:hypothetical protein [Bacillus mojavensis]MEC1289549.1 hypothetical protein [Bacillus mojavensis]MEC1704560.1 hypothetical protein [Bacillus mojavensis]MEC5246058.1 hypothetical protein [Bacillus mojavensis]